MATLSEFAGASGVLLRRFGLEVAISMAALVIVAFGVSRALPSADASRFDRGDAAWVGALAKADQEAPAPVAPPSSASLTIAPADMALALPAASDRLSAAAEPAPSARPVKLAIVPPRRPKIPPAPAEGASPLVATATPVAATSSDFLGLSRLTARLPSRETLLRPFNAVGSTVATFLKRP